MKTRILYEHQGKKTRTNSKETIPINVKKKNIQKNTKRIKKENKRKQKNNNKKQNTNKQ